MDEQTGFDVEDVLCATIIEVTACRQLHPKKSSVTIFYLHVGMQLPFFKMRDNIVAATKVEARRKVTRALQVLQLLLTLVRSVIDLQFGISVLRLIPFAQQA